MTADTASGKWEDEFDVTLADLLRDPVFARVYRRAQLWHEAGLPLAINGHDYRRRQLARRRRRR